MSKHDLALPCRIEWLDDEHGWIIDSEDRYVAEMVTEDEEGRIIPNVEGREAMGTFIVRAVNNHDALVKALRAQVDDWHANSRNRHRAEPRSLPMARAALALVEGEGTP